MAGYRSVGESSDAAIDGLLSGFAWSGDLSYAFTSSSTQYDYGPEADGLVPLAGTAQQEGSQVWAAIAAFDAVAAFTTLPIIQAQAAPGLADIRLAMTTTPDPSAGAPFTAYAFLPAGDEAGGDVWLNTVDYFDAWRGTYAWFTLLHEIGHAIGLKHGHEAEYGFSPLPDEQDSPEFSVMTYRSWIGDTPDFYEIADGNGPQGFMQLDIAALQWMYGADFAYRAGNTTYRFDPASGVIVVNGVAQAGPRDSAGNPVNVLFATIWDGDGTDTYDFSAYGAGFQLVIDLRPGAWTDVDSDSQAQAADLGGGPNGGPNGGHARGQIANALLYQGDPRSLIENAIGGAGDDSITGNAAANLLRGRGGIDVLAGLAGDDTLQGGAGNDTLDGGDGIDVASYADAPAALSLTLAPMITVAGLGTDTLIGIEGLEGSAFNDLLVGTAAANVLKGGGGSDRIYGQGGNDTLEGGDGNDVLYGRIGDTVIGGAGADSFRFLDATGAVYISLPGGWALDDTAIGEVTLVGIEYLTGGAFDDYLGGDATDNILRGLDGNDYLQGGLGTDLLDGGAGIDLASYIDSPGVVKVYLNDVSATGAAGTDYFVSIEGLVGSVYDDTLVGNDGANRLYGDRGNDRLYGLGGDDLLWGWLGDDIFHGGDGSDTADYSDATVTVRAILGTGATVNTTNFGRDRYFDVENLAGGSARDFLTGDANANVLTGNAGNDIIDGAAGDDTLRGGEGNDDLAGGLGADLIELGPAIGNDIVRFRAGADSGAGGMDRIVGFTASGPGFDRIGFENAPGALFAGVAPTTVALAATLALAEAATIADLVAQLGGLAASTATVLALTRIDVAAGGWAGSYLAVNDLAAGFDAATDMLVGIQFASAAPLGTGNFFLF